ncbi:MAG TPA: ATP-binding protein [Alphaproteobacteria bacterium]|jgi:two-component system cell cycle sensor histidine kinase PleC|nr:ATP-binding protein [Alphaproteobacteria bacterium]
MRPPPTGDAEIGHPYRSRMVKSDHRAIVGFHENGLIEFANPAAARIFGRELVGLSLDSILPQAHERLMPSKRTRLWTIGHRADGTAFPARVIVEAISANGDCRFLARVAALTGVSLAEPTLTSLINGMSDSATLWDHADRLILWNDRALEIHAEIADILVLGASFTNIIARSADLERPDGSSREEFIASSLARHQSATGNREEIWIGRKCLAVAERQLPGGAVLRLETDVTAQKLYEVELRVAKEKAEAASHSKSTFLANMSHELRTPLNAVIGFSDILKSQMLGPIGNDKYLEYASHISDSGAHLLHLVNYILDLSRVEAGHYELRREPLGPGELIADVLRLMRIGADKANIELVTPVAADLPRILVDRRAIRQVLLNILSNAIKFTPAGGRVSITAESVDDMVAIVVADTGIGIAKEDLPRLAKPFEQAGDAYSRNQGGTGLGLAITKQLVQLHDGSMRIDSVIGEGTTVTVRLPISAGSLDAASAG